MPAPSKVVLLHNLYAPHVVGGAEVMVSHLATFLKARGVDVTVVTTCGRDKSYEEDTLNGVRVIRFFPRNLWWFYERFEESHRPSRVAKAAWNIKDAWNKDSERTFGKILSRIRPDVVHTHNVRGVSPSVWRAARDCGSPIVHTAHDYHLLCINGSMINRHGTACETRCLRCRVRGHWYHTATRPIKALCAPSRYVLQQHTAAGVSAPVNVVIRNGIPAVRIARRARTPGPLRLLYMGQLIRSKGIEVLLQGLRLMPGGTILNIAGKGELLKTVSEAAHSSSQLRYHGFVSGSAKDELFAASDALVFPSVWPENAPISILEAMMAGLPVIGSNLGAIPEAIQDGVTGLLFRAGDARSLADAVEQLANDPAKLRALSENASRFAAAELTTEKMGERYLDLYKSVLSNQGSS